MSVAQKASEVSETVHNFVAGELAASSSGRDAALFNPATGEQSGRVGLSNAEDVNRAVAAACQPFPRGRKRHG